MIKKRYQINSSIDEVWKALTNSDYINLWGGGPAVMSDKVNGRFSLWGGDIWGKSIEIIPQKKLVQEWYGGNWAKPSVVTFKLSEINGVTTVGLTQIDVPKSDEPDFDSGWDEYYMGAIQNYFS